jgi:hypothetical protein
LTDKKVWFTPRALKLHAVLLVVVPAFMALCLWQVTRALDGNSLSWAYVFEWPIFAAYAVYMWWRLVHEASEDAPPPSAGEPRGGPGGANTTDSSAAAPSEGTAPARSARDEEQDAALEAYNEYLAQLAERDRASGP